MLLAEPAAAVRGVEVTVFVLLLMGALFADAVAALVPDLAMVCLEYVVESRESEREKRQYGM